MILGIGNDVCYVSRIKSIMNDASLAHRFMEKVFRAEEFFPFRYSIQDSLYAHYAKKFAAKEACAKALGCGFTEEVLPNQIIVKNNKDGQPYIELVDGALKRLELISFGYNPKIHVSLSLGNKIDHGIASAMVVIEGL